MANLIRLKQIESSALLESASAIAADFSAAVLGIVTGSVVGSLPDGVVSSSVQIDLVSASNYAGFVVQLDLTMSSDLETRVVSSSLAQTIGILSQTYLTTGSFNSYTSSLGNIFATDVEVYQTASAIIDQGEF